MDFLPIVGKSTITLKPELHRQFSRTGFFHHFILEVEKYCLEKDIPFNMLLLLDNAWVTTTTPHPNSWTTFILGSKYYIGHSSTLWTREL